VKSAPGLVIVNFKGNDEGALDARASGLRDLWTCLGLVRHRRAGYPFITRPRIAKDVLRGAILRGRIWPT
jgi:hypothetical protein